MANFMTPWVEKHSINGPSAQPFKLESLRNTETLLFYNIDEDMWRQISRKDKLAKSEEEYGIYYIVLKSELNKFIKNHGKKN